MPSSDGEAAKPMIENPARSALHAPTSEAAPDGAPPPKPPPGCVERVLTVYDRNLVCGACIRYCQQDGKKKLKDLDKLDRVKRLLRFDETLEFVAMNTDWLEDERVRWEGAKARYRLWRRWKEGILRAEDLKATDPNFDPGVEPERPPPQPPQLAREQRCGPARPVHVPSRLDAWIQEALRAMDWPSDMAEGASEIGRTFGVLDGE